MPTKINISVYLSSICLSFIPHRIIDTSVHGDIESPVAKKLVYVGWFGEVIGRDALPGWGWQLAVGILRPTQRGGDIAHLALDVPEREVAIGGIASCSEEVYTRCRSVDGYVLEGDIGKRIIGCRPHKYSIGTCVVDADVIERDIPDGIISGAANVHGTLCVPPEITAVTATATGTSAMLYRDIMDINRSVSVKSRTVEIRVHTHTALQCIGYKEVMSGVTFAAEEAQRTRAPVVLRRAVSEGHVLAFNHYAP